MITVLALMTLGIIIGVFISKKEKIIKLNEKLTSLAIFMLLFLLGIGVGTNEKIINNMQSIGLQALVLTLGALSGSILCAYITYNLFFKQK